MRTIKGPALFLAQFAGDAAPFNNWRGITAWAAGCGYIGVQIPSWDARLFDLAKAAASKDYCDEVKGIAAESGIAVTELSTHLQGQLVAVHPAYDTAFDGFAAPEVRGNPRARQEWAVDQVKLALTASRNLGLTAHATFSGALAWPYVYPWPQRPAGLVETAFDELARRWRPILEHAEDCGVDICYEIHPGEDLHDGISFEMFLERVGGHARCNMLYDPSHYVLQHLDYLENIEMALGLRDDESALTYSQLAQMAFQDQLSGLANFRYFTQRFSRNAAQRCHFFRTVIFRVLFQRFKICSSVADEIFIHQAFIDDGVDHRIQHRDIGVSLELEFAPRMAAKLSAAWIGDDQFCAVLDRVFYPGCRHRMVRGRVGTNEENDFGLGDIGHLIGHRAGSHSFEQCRYRRCVAQPRAMVNVIGAKSRADQLLEQIRFFIAALGAAETR